MHYLAVLVPLVLIDFVRADQLDSNLVEWLNEGGYLLNPEQTELDRLKPALEKAVSALENQSQRTDDNSRLQSSATVFQIGIVVPNKKLVRQIDFIHWARTIGMRALALGKRYVGVVFQLGGQRNRLYLFFVKPVEAVDFPKGRSGLNEKSRRLFGRLKEATTD